MKKLFLLLTLVALTGTLYAQKEEKIELNKKTNEFTTASGEVVFLLEDSKSTSYPGVNNHYINNKEGKHMIFFVYKVVTRDRYKNKNDPEGKMSYYEVNFMGMEDQRCEIRYYNLVKNLGQMVYEKKLIQNGALNTESVKAFVMESGNNISAY